jgi:hypothetical protein
MQHHSHLGNITLLPFLPILGVRQQYHPQLIIQECSFSAQKGDEWRSA